MKLFDPGLVSSVHATEVSFNETQGGWKQRILFIGSFVYSMYVYQCFDWRSLKNENKAHARRWEIGTLTTVVLENAL